MQRETIATGLWGANITCQYHGDQGGWVVKQSLNWAHKKIQVRKIMPLWKHG